MDMSMHSRGTPFRAVSLLAADDANFVVPDATIQHPAPGTAGVGYVDGMGLVITGIHFHFAASAASVGFTLYARDYLTTPTGVQDPIYRYLSQAAGDHSQEINCFWPLRRGDAKTTPFNPSKIELDVSSTAPTNGILVVQGFQTSEDFGNFATTGSPVIF